LFAEDIGDGSGRVEDGAFPTGFSGEAAGQFERGLKGDGFVGSDSPDFAEAFPRSSRQFLEGAETVHQVMAKRDCRRTAQTGAKENGQEFGLTE